MAGDSLRVSHVLKSLGPRAAAASRREVLGLLGAGTLVLSGCATIGDIGAKVTGSDKTAALPRREAWSPQVFRHIALSPDGRTALIDVQESYQASAVAMYQYDLEARRSLRWAMADGRTLMQGSFAPDGRRFAAIVHDASAGQGADAPIAVLAATGNMPVHMLGAAGHRYSYPVYSADGARIAAWRRPVGGGALQLVEFDAASGTEKLFSEAAFAMDGVLAYAADGQMLYTAAPGLYAGKPDTFLGKEGVANHHLVRRGGRTDRISASAPAGAVGSNAQFLAALQTGETIYRGEIGQGAARGEGDQRLAMITYKDGKGELLRDSLALEAMVFAATPDGSRFVYPKFVSGIGPNRYLLRLAVWDRSGDAMDLRDAEEVTKPAGGVTLPVA